MTRRQIEIEVSALIGTLIYQEFVVSISLEESEDYFYGEWWVSRIAQSGELRMFAHFSLPVDAETIEEAKEKAKDIADELMKVVRFSVFAEEAGLLLIPDPREAGFIFRAHVQAHFQAHYGKHFAMITATQRTVRLYNFAKSVGISTPAVAVAEIEGVEPKTVHERLRESKKKTSVKNRRNN